MITGNPHIPWRYGQFGPGGGSLPANVMRTGGISPFNPKNVRHDIQARYVRDAVMIPVGHRGGALTIPTGGDTPVPGVSTKASTEGVLLGAAADGRPVRKFDVPGAPTVPEARVAAGALKRNARLLAKNRLFGLSPALIGGPLASLASGEATVLRWTNGIQIGISL